MFLLLCKFWRNNYLLEYWKAIYMQKCPYIGCMGLIFVAQGQLLVWMLLYFSLVYAGHYPFDGGMQVQQPICAPRAYTRQGQLLLPACRSLSKCSGQCLPLETAVVLIAHTHPWSSCGWHLVEYVQEKKLLSWFCPSPHVLPPLPQQWHLASLEGLVFWVYSELLHSNSFSYLWSANPVLSSDLWSLNFGTQPPPTLVEEHLRLGNIWYWYLLSLQATLHFAFCILVATLYSKDPKHLLCPGWSSHQWENFQGYRNPSSFRASSLWCRSHPDFFLSFFFPFFLLSYLVMWSFSSPFKRLRSSASIQ